jgi:hypothetical protein
MFWMKLGGYGIIAIAGFLLAWRVNGWRNDSQELHAIKPAFEALVDSRNKANEEIQRLLLIDEGEMRRHAEALVALDRQRAETSRAWEAVKTLEEHIDVETGCPVVRLSDDWGVCFAAAAGGHPSDITSCEAARINGASASGSSN